MSRLDDLGFRRRCARCGWETIHVIVRLAGRCRCTVCGAES